MSKKQIKSSIPHICNSICCAYIRLISGGACFPEANMEGGRGGAYYPEGFNLGFLVLCSHQVSSSHRKTNLLRVGTKKMYTQ